MKASAISAAWRTLVTARQPAFIWGAPGIGNLGMYVIDLIRYADGERGRNRTFNLLIKRQTEVCPRFFVTSTIGGV